MRFFISIAIIALLSGCADLGYYWHSVNGHLKLMSQRVDIEDLLADQALAADLRERLTLVGEIRLFAVDRLALPDNASYASFVQLDKPYVLQNLFAATEFSTQLHSWCYPIVGCTSYRGYYDEARLQRYIDSLEKTGLEVYVGQVSAYSTLGWFDDPVLSSFIDWPEYRLAGLLFHELVHQRIYIDDDSEFNESLASAVQQAGTILWLQARQQSVQLAGYQLWLNYRREVMQLIASTRGELNQLYAQPIGDDQKRLQKRVIFARAVKTHAAIAQARGIADGYSDWFASEMNNAKMGSVSVYNARLPAFLKMIEFYQGDFAAFFVYVEQLGELPRMARDLCLDAWEMSAEGNQHCAESRD